MNGHPSHICLDCEASVSSRTAGPTPQYRRQGELGDPRARVGPLLADCNVVVEGGRR